MLKLAINFILNAYAVVLNLFFAILFFNDIILKIDFTKTIGIREAVIAFLFLNYFIPKNNNHEIFLNNKDNKNCIGYAVSYLISFPIINYIFFLIMKGILLWKNLIYVKNVKIWSSQIILEDLFLVADWKVIVRCMD